MHGLLLSLLRLKFISFLDAPGAEQGQCKTFFLVQTKVSWHTLLIIWYSRQQGQCETSSYSPTES
jgi:hypothetical protein